MESCSKSGDFGSLAFNGVDGSSPTGDYLQPRLTLAMLAKRLKRQREAMSYRRGRGVMADIDATSLAESGWAIIYSSQPDPGVREALRPLERLRKEQAGDRFRVYSDENGFRPGDSALCFLQRHHMGPGPVDPEVVPYYLLLVGDAQKIPFHFQFDLGAQYAVGRLSFETPQEFADYAASVVAAEGRAAPAPRRLALFGVENQNDPATRLSTRDLVEALAEVLIARLPDWEIEAVLRSDASRARLASLLGGEETPSLLLTASHGMGYSSGHCDQEPYQGAILCSDWPGPKKWRKPIAREHFFAAEDIGDDARLSGLIHFQFACYGAGTPATDQFSHRLGVESPPILAPRPFIASLPKRMLGHSRGGALAFVGHVDRAWGYSFAWRGAGRQIQAFQSAMSLLSKGAPVGWALEGFSQRYLTLTMHLAEQWKREERGGEVDPRTIAALWTASNDARGYTLLGDPAVRLS